VAIEIIDGQRIETDFILEYLKRPEGDPVRVAAEKWQAQQEAGVRSRQPKGTATTVAGVPIERRDIKPLGPSVDPLSAKKRTAAEQKKANDKAKAAGAALPFPEAAKAEARTTTPYEERKAGRATVTTGTAKPVKTDTIADPATTDVPADVPADTPVVTPPGDKPPVPPKGKKTTVVDVKTANEEQLTKAGINQAVVQYMKENYPDDWKEIKLLRDSATKTDGKIDENELRRIKTAFENTQYFKNAVRENNRTTIGAYFILNGIDTASSAALIDKLTDDVYVNKITTIQQAQAQIRRNAVDRLGLNRPDADPDKRKIAQAMIDGGQAFTVAAAKYVSEYTDLMGIPLNQFDLFEDQGFLNAFLDSTSLNDFKIKAKSSPTYTNTAIGRQEINAAKLRLQGLSRSLGLGYNPEQLEQQAANIVAGRQTYEQLEFNTRSIAGEAFPMFKDRILAGESIANIAAPYTRSMSSILELPESSLDISDPNSEIRKALIGDGKTPKPLWQFEQELFKDARWQYTSNARDTMDRVSMDILQRFGVMG
jgi:hypothetical protein